MAVVVAWVMLSLQTLLQVYITLAGKLSFMAALNFQRDIIPICIYKGELYITARGVKGPIAEANFP